MSLATDIWTRPNLSSRPLITDAKIELQKSRRLAISAAGQGRAGQGRAGQDRAGQGRAEQNRIIQKL